MNSSSRPRRRYEVPWWLLAIAARALTLWALVADQGYAQIFRALSGGVATTPG
jgi:polar amino acid transport system permease protein